LRKVVVGVIGTGQISGIYLKNLKETFDDIIELKAVADQVPELAAKRAEQFGVPNAWTVERLLADPDIELVLNLTAPVAHAPINLAALRAGKHIYTEKPFALTREDANEVLELAEKQGLLVGCAPDTFLGGGLQTCRKLIDDGWIGTPYSANGTIIMGNAWNGLHPNFRNFLKLGGDPIMDMAPYYLTAMVFLLGPVRRVSGTAQQLHREMTVRNPKSAAYGETVPIEAPTNVSAVLDFAGGAVGSLQAAKESFGYLPRLEIFGTEGNLTRERSELLRRTRRRAVPERRDEGISDRPRLHGRHPRHRTGRHGVCHSRRPTPPRERRVGPSRARRLARHFRIVAGRAAHRRRFDRRTPRAAAARAEVQPSRRLTA
jgi:Predicted dehydrogenases and related proteins